MIGHNSIEIIRRDAVPRRVRAVLFDWDGTLSLLREGWSAVMTAQMLGVLRDAGVELPDAERTVTVESIVVGLNGRPTVVQMQALTEIVHANGGRPLAPEAYLADYQNRLSELLRDRYAAIESETVRSHDWAVFGAWQFLQHLRSRGLPIIVISGTTREQVVREMRLLEFEPLIDELHAPSHGDAAYSKRQVIEGLLAGRRIAGSELLGFGDGVIETEDVRRVDGVAIAVASAEPPQRGVNTAKRDRLIRAGADAVIADYENFPKWLHRLIDEE